MNKIKNIFKWSAGILAGAFLILVIARVPVVYQKEKTDAQIAKIYATKLTMDDVMGVNLPPDPGADADKTVAGIDANNNGIRDDVELAIFKEYPNSAKTRAVLLQYALVLQMDAIQPFNEVENATEVSREQSRAYDCISQFVPKDDHQKYIEIADELNAFVDERQRNTPERKMAREKFAEQIRSYSESDNQVCDIDLSKLVN